MITECQHHAHCDPASLRSTPPITFYQATLSSNFGILSLSRRPPPRSPSTGSHRTPLPHAIRRITNDLTFSTTDPSQTTFLRLPPEIRIPIYRLLLKSPDTIHYGICPVKKSLVWRRYKSSKRRIRHGLFPSILECCRVTNHEGNAVLYSENRFQMERETSSKCAIRAWGIGQSNFESITMLNLVSCSWDPCAQDRKVLEMVDLFPKLKDVQIHLSDVFPEDWEGFLVEASERLRRIQKVCLEVYVSQKAGGRICSRQWEPHQKTDEERCLLTYKPPFLKQESVWKNRNVRWVFHGSGDYARCHCVLGSVMVLLE